MNAQTITGFSSLGTGADQWTFNKNGGTDPAINSGTLSLLPAQTTVARSIFFNTAQSVTRFNVSFRFDNGSDGSGSDGFTFVLQNGANTALGNAGGNLGYGAAGGDFANSAAVSFNIVNNDSLAFGQAGNTSGLEGFADLVPSNGPNTALLDLADIAINYDGSVLSITVTNVNNPTQSATREVSVDIPTLIGSDTALLGFTAGNFTATAMTLSNFSYAAVPEPTTYAALMGAMAIGFCLIRRRR
ncbi:MAG: PEP-CTERM sorting domain-containing protein [Verrucomicrobiota bacterium]